MLQLQQYYIKNNGGCSAKVTIHYFIINAFITVADSSKSRLVN